MTLPEPIRKLIDRLAELPGIGPRQATRLAFYLANLGKDAVHGIASDISGLKTIKQCSRCFFIHERTGLLCDICENKNRNHGIIAIVEKETDLMSLENVGKFTGRYLIVGTILKTGMLSDLQKLRIQGLKSFIKKELQGKADEIILAFNPTANGDFNVSLLAKELAPFAKKNNPFRARTADRR